MGVVGGSARKGRIGREKRGTREERGPGEDFIGEDFIGEDFIGEGAREATCVEAEVGPRNAGRVIGSMHVPWGHAAGRGRRRSRPCCWRT